MRQLVGFFFASAALSLALTGCEWEVYEEGSGQCGSAESAEICTDYCFELMSCGSLDYGDFDTCTSECSQEYDEDPDDTEDGYRCVLSSACGDEFFDCDGAPLLDFAFEVDGHVLFDFGSSCGAGGAGSSTCDDDSVDPDPGDGSGGADSGAIDGSGGTDAGTGGSGTDTATGGSTGTTEPVACTVNHDCGDSEDCIEGYCSQRCAASCQCSEGLACVDSYCAEPPEPVVECEDLCDCPAGQLCVEGMCE